LIAPKKKFSSGTVLRKKYYRPRSFFFSRARLLFLLFPLFCLRGVEEEEGRGERGFFLEEGDASGS
jgi:hypothetical protein